MKCRIRSACVVAVLFSIGAGAPTLQQSNTQSPTANAQEAVASNDASLRVSPSKVLVLDMSDEEFGTFAYRRKVFREQLARHFHLLEQDSERSGIEVQHPHGREFLTALALKGRHMIPLTQVMEECRDVWQWFPEIVELDVSRFEANAIPESTVTQIVSLRHLKKLTLATSKSVEISEKSLELLSKHGDFEELVFGRCRITEHEFSHLTCLKTLSAVTVCGRVTPRCFITLAKLPHFQRFTLVGGSRIDSASFGDPIDEETRRAIVSLNGRLQCVSAIEETLPQMHGTLLRALGAVESLEVLDLGGVLVREVTLQDIEALQHLSNLRHFVLAAQYAPSVTPEERKRADEVVRQIKRRVGERQRIEKQTMLREAGVLPGNSSP